MKISERLIGFAIVMHCGMGNVGSEINGFESDSQDTHYAKHSKISNLKNITAKSTEHDPDLDKSILKINSAGFEAPNMSWRTALRRQAEQFLDLANGPRIKKHVLRNFFGLNTTWLGGVPYMFNTSDPVVQKMFKMGAKIWSDSTCIDFVEDKNSRDKLVVVKDDTCWSNTGRLGGEQLLSLSASSTVGSAVHEIGHALGLIHTIQRYDRDDYIRILFQNVDSTYIDEFNKVSPKLADVYELSYDYGSVMHYDELSGSTNGQTTLIAIDPNYQKTMGSEMISFSDILLINKHYKCNAKCNNSTSAKCTNEGFPHPRNCSICICPSGYGGALCDQRPPGCGDDLEATSKKRTLTYRIGFGADLRDHFDFCNYRIKAPKGKKIEVDVRSISHGYDRGGCPLGGVEIKAQKDQKLTGYRFCSPNGTENPIVSNFNRLPVILFNRLGTMEAILTYRYID